MIPSIEVSGWKVYYDSSTKSIIAVKETKQLPEVISKILDDYGVKVPMRTILLIETKKVELSKEKCKNAFEILEDLVETVRTNILEVMEYALIRLVVETLISYRTRLDEKALLSKNIENKVREMIRFVDGTISVLSGKEKSKPAISIYVSWEDEKYRYVVNVIFMSGVEKWG